MHTQIGKGTPDMQDVARELTSEELETVGGGLAIGRIIYYVCIADLFYDFAKGVSDGYSGRAN
ncbi:hypothetical protein P6166_09495 [Stenotrophomonas sp. HITSZ_GD]|uniref:hypothetical protein n=1 Tax=Stenotrophomonas sp. HITSZ_GD TaxID=3037248 RepID=UPI00240DB302|nr:hypothetical protein [Stenotrophomonas sp. HITSZ_GD]MDG2525587.1 hypothetical protein [Stenotrophomonas sp. HITSZ_GD]